MSSERPVTRSGQALRPVTGSAQALREAFDRGFAEPRSGGGQRVESMIAIRVGTDSYAVPLSEIASVHADHKVVVVPSPAPELLGIAGFRGVIVPVYDLRVLLGNASRTEARWLMLARAPELVALAFDVFEGHLRLNASDVFDTDESSSDATLGPHIRGSVRALSGSRPILRVSSLLRALASRLRVSEPAKER